MCIKNFFIILTLTFSVSIGHAQWVQTGGPTGGMISALALLDGDVFAGTQSGVYRSTDSGKSWNCVTSGSQNAPIQALAVLDSDLFAATTTGVLRSTNKGISWDDADQGFIGSPTVLSAMGSELFLVTESDTAFRSTDLGATWNAIPTLTDSTVTSFANIGGMFFAGAGHSGIVFSTDSGLTWQRAANVGLFDSQYYWDPYITALGVIGTNLLAAGDCDLFDSKDSGTTWDLFANIFPAAGINSADCFAFFNSKLFAGTGSNIYASTDAGKSWVTESADLNYMEVTSIQPIGNKIIAGTYSSGLFISTDAGASWNSDDSGLVRTNVTGFALLGSEIFARCEQPIVGENEGSVYSLNHDGYSWKYLTDSLMKSHWYNAVYSIAASDGDVFAVDENRIFVSHDSGMTWSTCFTSQNQGFLALYPTPDGLFATTGNGIYESDDDGDTWSSANTGIAANDAYMLTIAQGPSAIYCGSSDGAVYFSSDNGGTWNNITPPHSTENIEAIACAAGNIVVGGTQGLFVSSDNGMTWRVESLNKYPISSLLAVGSNVFAGTPGGIYVSTDGGNTWSSQNQGLATLSVNALVVQGSDLYAGTEGGGVWHRPLSEMINFNAVQTVAVLPAYEQSYPNPFTRQTTIPFSLTRNEHVTVTIFNMLGQEIRTLADQDFNGGMHQVVWDAGSATSGTYFCRIATPDGVQTQLLVLERGAVQ
jgi:photosystem II stability/assembly factor-like uncharacterized protein